MNLGLANFASDGTVKTLTLQNLQGETFVSHTSNALKENVVEANPQGGTTTATSYSINSFKMTLPAKSITAILLTSKTPKVVDPTDAIKPRPASRASAKYGKEGRYIDTKGRNVVKPRPGYYILRIGTEK